MTRRYFVPDLLSQFPLVTLTEDEAMHAIRVMRIQAGDSVELFDGQGTQATGLVENVARRECVCRCERPELVSREPTHKLEIATALPKPDRAKEMIERMTELGVSKVWPIVFERTQRPPTDSLLGKLRRVVLESCKQSGRNQLMPIHDNMRLSAYFKSIADAQTRTDFPLGAGDRKWVAMPGDVVPSWSANFSGSQPLSKTIAIIGPEGGLTDCELKECEAAGFVAVDLGKRILRIETAACVIAARVLID